MYDLGRCVYLDKMVISHSSALRSLPALHSLLSPLILVQKPAGKLCIQNKSDWIREHQSDLIPMRSCPQMVVNANFLLPLICFFPSTSSFATAPRYNICRDYSKKKENVILGIQLRELNADSITY